jgi:hypothetical protein
VGAGVLRPGIKGFAELSVQYKSMHVDGGGTYGKCRRGVPAA